MKKALTKNITRYDDKMRIKSDRPTILAALRSAALAVAAYFIVGMFASILVQMPIAVIVFLASFIFQIGTVGGMRLTEYVGEMLRLSGDPRARRKPYEFTDTNRLNITKGGAADNETQKQKRSKKQRRSP